MKVLKFLLGCWSDLKYCIKLPQGTAIVLLTSSRSSIKAKKFQICVNFLCKRVCLCLCPPDLIKISGSVVLTLNWRQLRKAMVCMALSITRTSLGAEITRTSCGSGFVYFSRIQIRYFFFRIRIWLFLRAESDLSSVFEHPDTDLKLFFFFFLIVRIRWLL